MLIDNILLVWLIIGILFISLEALGISGIGFLFAGLAAITVGGLINFEIIAANNYYSQILTFFIAIVGWLMLLWRPMKNFYANRKVKKFHNIVGDEAIVLQDLNKENSAGVVKWSGVKMSAQIDEKSAVDIIKTNEYVIVKDLQGITLIVDSK
ncbi:MAG: NfeD family protein [Pseudomonadota bacterium]